jgi:hypothetical protein
LSSGRDGGTALWHGLFMPSDDTWINAADRVALLRHGIVALESDEAGLRLGVTGAGEDRVRETIARRLGSDVTVEVLGDLPRRLEPRPCVGYMEREPRRLQLRFALRGDQHVDEVVVAEDETTVVVFATVCTSVRGEPRAWCEGPVHVYLESALGDRTVIDGVSGDAVPYKNVYAALGTPSWR